jgi:hypothetical protein
MCGVGAHLTRAATSGTVMIMTMVSKRLNVGFAHRP